MNTLRSIVWFTPFAILAAGFFTSRIGAYRSGRYLIYTVVLFGAFLFDLQSTSFRYDKIDILFTLLVLFVFTDFFWRVARRRSRILKIGGLVTGVLLFVWVYHEWILVGPASLNRLWNAQCLSEFRAGNHHLYYVKQRCPVTRKKASFCNLVLLKTRRPAILEQRIDQYHIPRGYEDATLSFVWDTSAHLVSVQIVGNNDTLWTLSEPLPQEP